MDLPNTGFALEPILALTNRDFVCYNTEFIICLLDGLFVEKSVFLRYYGVICAIIIETGVSYDGPTT